MYLATLSTFDNLKRGKILDFFLSCYVCSIKKKPLIAHRTLIIYIKVKPTRIIR